jgi:glycosyltransferase involved in cell wall biosynthesis
MKALSVATVARSLRLQAPAQWEVLRELGFDVTFAAAHDEHAQALSDAGEFMQLRMERSLGVSSTRAVVDLRALLRRDWQLVQLQSPIAASLSRLALPRQRSYPVLYVVHGFHFHPDGHRAKNAMAFRLEQMLRGRADHIAVVSAWDYDAALRMGVPSERLTRLPGAGVDIERFLVAPTRDGSGRLLFVGDLNANKDPLRAIRVAHEVRRRQPTTTLTVVGSGPLEADCARLVDELDAGGWVTMVRHTSEIPALMAEADVLLSCSAREGLPRVLIEAMAAGAPIVARANRGSRELVEDGAGLLLDPLADDAAWVDAVVEVLGVSARGGLRAGPTLAAQWDTAHFAAAYRALVQGLCPSLGPGS